MDELLATTIEVENVLGEIGKTRMNLYKKKKRSSWCWEKPTLINTYK